MKPCVKIVSMHVSAVDDETDVIYITDRGGLMWTATVKAGAMNGGRIEPDWHRIVAPPIPDDVRRGRRKFREKRA